MMHFVALHVDSAEGVCRAKMLAFAATDTFLRVDKRHFYGVTVDLFADHLDRFGRAMTCTCAARISVVDRNAVLLNPYCVTDMNGSFLFRSDTLDSSRGANLAATCTLGTAVAALE